MRVVTRSALVKGGKNPERKFVEKEKVVGMAKGGKMHSDEKEDRVLIKKVLAEKGLKKGGKVAKMAMGGAAKVRQGIIKGAAKPKNKNFI